MATTFTEIEQNPGVTIDDNALVKRTRTFRGINQNPAVSNFTILEDFGNATLIRRYSPYVGPDLVGDPTCLASSIEAHQTDKMIEWLVKVNYSTMRYAARPNLSPRQQRERAAMAREHQASGQQPPADPTERQIVLSIGSQEYEENFLEDALREIEPGVKEPVWNAARERPVPPPTRPLSFRVVRLEKNERLFSSDFTHGFENTVNDATWYGYQPTTVLCKSITAEADFEGRWDFWRVTYVFWVRKAGWAYKMLNEGTYHLVTAGNYVDRVHFRDKKTSGNLPTGLLAEDGTALPTSGRPNYLFFNRYETRNFALLGLGT